MALKTLIMNKQLRDKRSALEALKRKAEEFSAREKQLEADIEAANTAEEQAAVEEAINAFDLESGENTRQIATLEGEIAELENQLNAAEREQNTGKSAPEARSDTRNDQNRRIDIMNRSLSRRELTRETLTHAEVRDFYSNLVTLVQTRATGTGNSLTNSGLVIPEIVMARINDRMGDYATVAREVETISVGGTSRVVLDGADPEAIWVEQSGAISEIESGFKKVEFDGYKLAGYMAIPNDIIDDAMINLAEYVEKKIAKAIAKSRDKAILNGTGSTGKQMVGIIPSLHDANKPAAVEFNLGAILAQIGLVDDGEEAYGEIIGVMKRSTFYKRFVRNLITVDSAGRYVVPNLSAPNIGVRVVFSQYMEEDKVLFGDFKRYMIAERSGMKLEASTDVRFIEDQTIIKGLQRMDGKPIHVDENNKTKDWVLVEITDGAAQVAYVSGGNPVMSVSASNVAETAQNVSGSAETETNSVKK